MSNSGAGQAKPAKIPESVLVVIHSADGQVLLLERADHPGFWQSVTGSKDHADEPLAQTCRREVMEETGLDVDQFVLEDWSTVNRYEIYPQWRHRYAAGVTHNTEHVFGLRLPNPQPVRLASREHLASVWLQWRDAAERCFSMSNVQAIRQLQWRLSHGAGPVQPDGPAQTDPPGGASR
jgi:dihydroneopterin triphosphate diphosphatase